MALLSLACFGDQESEICPPCAKRANNPRPIRRLTKWSFRLHKTTYYELRAWGKAGAAAKFLADEMLQSDYVRHFPQMLSVVAMFRLFNAKPDSSLPIAEGPQHCIPNTS